MISRPMVSSPQTVVHRAAASSKKLTQEGVRHRHSELDIKSPTQTEDELVEVGMQVFAAHPAIDAENASGLS
jgi:hypothetical protein